MVDIIPAILTDDLEILEKELRDVQKLCNAVQIDVMDNTLAPGKTIAPKDLGNIGEEIFLEAHLMVEHPEGYLEDFYNAGASRIIFHIEGKDDPEKLIKKIKKMGMEAGLAFNPETPIPDLNKLYEGLDEALLLSVTPGKQGQPFQETVVHKIAEIRDLYPRLIIGVDGGISDRNAPLVEAAGVNIIYVGHYLWKSKNPKLALQKLILALNE